MYLGSWQCDDSLLFVPKKGGRVPPRLPCPTSFVLLWSTLIDCTTLRPLFFCVFFFFNIVFHFKNLRSPNCLFLFENGYLFFLENDSFIFIMFRPVFFPFLFFSFYSHLINILRSCALFCLFFLWMVFSTYQIPESNFGIFFFS